MADSKDGRGSGLFARVPQIAGLPPAAVGLIGIGVVALAGTAIVNAVGGLLALVFESLGSVFTVLLLALISAYLLDPVIDRFERAGWDRSLGIGISLGTSLAGLAIVLLLLVPYVVTEVADLSENVDGYLADFGKQAGELEDWLVKTTGQDIDLRFSAMTEKLPKLLEKVGSGGSDPSSLMQSVFARVSSFFGGAMGFLVTWALFPIFAFFFLRDFDIGKTRLFELVPHRWRGDALDTYRGIDGKMAAFVRGQFILCCTLAVLYSLGLGLFTDIDLAVLVGVLSGLLFVVPYLGTFFGLLAGTSLALLKFGVSVEVLKVWAVFVVVQGIEGAFLTPKIVGDSVGLHPVVVMLALVIGGNLFGFLGILLAVPVAAALQVVLSAGMSRYKATEWFLEGADDAPGVDELP